MQQNREFLELVSDWYATSESVVVDRSHADAARQAREDLEHYLDAHPELCPA